MLYITVRYEVKLIVMQICLYNNFELKHVVYYSQVCSQTSLDAQNFSNNFELKNVEFLYVFTTS